VLVGKFVFVYAASWVYIFVHEIFPD
jgi:hypothetical protein